MSTAAVLQTLGLRMPGPSSTALAGDGFWSGTGAHPRGWEVGKPRGSWGAVKRALGLEPCRAGIESWFNHLSILGPRGQKLYLSERIARELQKYSIIKRRLGEKINKRRLGQGVGAEGGKARINLGLKGRLWTVLRFRRKDCGAQNLGV